MKNFYKCFWQNFNNVEDQNDLEPKIWQILNAVNLQKYPTGFLQLNEKISQEKERNFTLPFLIVFEHLQKLAILADFYWRSFSKYNLFVVVVEYCNFGDGNTTFVKG